MSSVLRAGRVLAVAVLSAGLPGCEQLPEVPNIPPVATFIHSPVSPINAGQTSVAFNAAGSSDSDGSIVSYAWNFGDGTAEQTGSGPTVAHVFPVVGRCLEVTYAVLLTVVDDRGGRGSASQTVTVINPPAPTSVECAPAQR